MAIVPMVARLPHFIEGNKKKNLKNELVLLHGNPGNDNSLDAQLVRIIIGKMCQEK
jgi:hypothetical protein